MADYLPLLLLGVLAALFGGLSFLVSRLLAPSRPTPAKLAPYESGIVPGRGPAERFPVRFFLVAMLFIMFDVEIIFLFPWAVEGRNLGAYGFWAILFFSVIFFLSFVYEIARGGLEWGPVKRGLRFGPAVSAERTAATTIRRVGLEGRPVGPTAEPSPGEVA